MSEFNRKQELKRYLVWFVVGLTFVLAMEGTRVNPGALFDRDGIRNAGELLSGLLSPNLSPDFLQRIFLLSFESLFVGILGTVFAVVIGIGLAMFAIRIPELPDPPGRQGRRQSFVVATARTVSRFTLGFFRSIPEIVWAYLFVQILGLGPGAAVLAIGLTVGGSIGKLYAELAEAVDRQIIGGLRAAGVGRWGILMHGILPQVKRQWVAYALFRMECNIRTGTILGVVGAGGLGSEIALSIRYLEFDKLATTLIAVLMFVIALEWVSAYLRRHPVKWALLFAAVGGIASFAYLDIPWMDLLTGNWSNLPGTTEFDLSAEFLGKTATLVWQTLLMAWIATLLAAVFAFFLAPLSTRSLVTGSYLSQTYGKRGLSLWMSRLLQSGSQFFLQVTRAMPELTLALVFVVWVGPGALAGILAIAVHNIGVLGRLYTDVYEEVEPGPAKAMQASGASGLSTWLYAVLPQVSPRVLAFTLYRFEVNVRATATVGFVGAGGIGDSLYTSISLFHISDLVVLLVVMVAVVTLVDQVGDRMRKRILNGPSCEPPLAQRLANLFSRTSGAPLTSPMTSDIPKLEVAQLCCRCGAAPAFSVIRPVSLSSQGLTFISDKFLPTGLMVQLVVVYPDGKLSSVISARACPSVSPAHSIDSKTIKNYLSFIEPAPDFLSAMIVIAQRDAAYFIDDSECSTHEKNARGNASISSQLDSTIA
ncbi:PhnE/PtxC family ABC transporter permease [Cellvibrio fibrivorans]|uniref:Phosphonate transport system permease protein n=1 Tax=Cellvibrio fibrivorans TaxID=126350 RepID=A0ABU1UTW6_9GAMM|nr:ABC transporter permease subunit [Cellvibrio fibrivorans]MDR7088621.1 phosphonate transport system permease protein [Cellvibrio fibrivorans]